MASNIDNQQLLTFFVSAITALTSGCANGGGSTSITQMLTSVSNQNTADTGLSVTEKRIATAISSAMGSTQPSSALFGASALL